MGRNLITSITILLFLLTLATCILLVVTGNLNERVEILEASLTKVQTETTLIHPKD